MCAVSTSKFRGQFLSCYFCNDSGICLRATDNLNQIAYHHCPLFFFGFKQFSIDLGLSVLELYQICFSSQSGIDMGKPRLGSLHNRVTIFVFVWPSEKRPIKKWERRKRMRNHYSNRVLDSNCECNFTFSPVFSICIFCWFFFINSIHKIVPQASYTWNILSDLFHAQMLIQVKFQQNQLNSIKKWKFIPQMRLKLQMSLLFKVTAVAFAVAVAACLKLGINKWIFLNMIEVILQSVQDTSTRRRTLVQTNINSTET